jgi:hypothetical protein
MTAYTGAGARTLEHANRGMPTRGARADGAAP